MPVTFSARGPIALPPTGPTLDVATTAWITAVGTVSTAQQGYVDTLIRGLKTDPSGNLFAILDRLWLFAGEGTVNSNQAKIDIISLQSNTLIGTPTLSAAGYQGSTNNAINSNFIPSTAGGNFTQNSATLGVYEQTTIVENNVRIGSNNSANSAVTQNINGTNSFMPLNLSGSGVIASTATSDGCWILTRTGSTTTTTYRNNSATPIATDSGVSVAVDVVTFGILCRGLTGTVNDSNSAHFDEYTTAQLSAVFIGGGLTATQSVNLANLLNAYMTSWTINKF